MAGRRTKLTPERQKKICDNIRIGMSYERAAQAAGICNSTFKNWRQRGEAEHERLAQKGARKRKREAPFLAFLAALQDAEAEGELSNIAAVRAAGHGGRQSTEVRQKFEGGKLVEEVTTVREDRPDWRANSWLLERRHPERWGKHERLDLRVEDVDAAIERELARVAAARESAIPGAATGDE